MKRIIVDYSKLTNEILNLLVEKFPDGYDDSDIIRFKNHKDETIEAVEVRTEDTIYLVKINTKLSDRMVNFDDDDDVIVPLEAIKGIDLDEEDDDAPSDDDDDIDDNLDKPEIDDDEEDEDRNDIADDDEDEDDED